jgi:Mn-dependent DtxR family transcriptional regulator
MGPLEYEIKGVKLTEKEIVQISEFYKNYSMAEYLYYTYGISEEEARNGAAAVLDMIENHGYEEHDAIFKYFEDRGIEIDTE